MATQLNLFSGQVIPTALHTEMQQSYLEYAMSVIVGRALPDVRDGLKPVHRRILYAMHELGLTPDRPYRKCARVVGDVLGKYHPHGDQSVYDALVRMVQDFSSRYPLLAGHGNFGSVDNDPAAAMRYTETRLASVSHEAMLAQIGEDTVNFIGNFDNSQQEPTVLPAQLPFLILNGCSGIAVGMATNIPPHNLGEVVDGLIALIDHPELSDQELFELIPGPDFPTGGEFVNPEGIIDAYTKGKGSIQVRGIAHIEEITTGNRRKQTRTAIVVTELPFQVNKAGWIEKTAELVNAGKLEGISDLRDESDRTGIRVVIELKKDISPQVVLNNLYQHTELQNNFGAILLALVNGLPRQLTLRQLLQEFLTFRELTLTRFYNHDLQVSQRRCHIVQGLLIALGDLDATIEILRNAPDGSVAKQIMQNRLGLSETQTDAILAMPLRRLTGLERQNLETEFNELTKKIEDLQGLLGDRRELLKALKKELRSLKRKYGDPRRTRLVIKETAKKTGEKGEVSGETKEKGREKKTNQSLVMTPLSPVSSPPEDVTIEFTAKQYVRRTYVTESSRGRSRDKGGQTEKTNDDFSVNVFATKTDKSLVVLTRFGKAYPLKVADIPANGSRDRGSPLITLLSPSASKDGGGKVLPEIGITQFIWPDAIEEFDLVMLSHEGKIKRLPLAELTELTNRGVTVIKLKENDELRYASLTQRVEQVVLATSGGRVLRFKINDEQLPPMGKVAQGSQATRLRKQEELVGCAIVRPEDSVLLVSQLGWAKRMSVDSVRLSNRGDIGTQGFHFSNSQDSLVGLFTAVAGKDFKVITNVGRVLRVNMDEISLRGKDATGSQIVNLNPSEKIIKVFHG
jgi:DNA gyrase subunit A